MLGTGYSMSLTYGMPLTAFYGYLQHVWLRPCRGCHGTQAFDYLLLRRGIRPEPPVRHLKALSVLQQRIAMHVSTLYISW